MLLENKHFPFSFILDTARSLTKLSKSIVFLDKKMHECLCDLL